jgi:protoheme IX farnesyltransferase
VLGALFLAEVHRMHLRAVRGSEVQTMRLFHESNIYLTLLFAALAVDALIH